MGGGCTSSSSLAGLTTEVESGSRRDTTDARGITLMCSRSIFAVRLIILEEGRFESR